MGKGSRDDNEDCEGLLKVFCKFCTDKDTTCEDRIKAAMGLAVLAGAGALIYWVLSLFCIGKWKAWGCYDCSECDELHLHSDRHQCYDHCTHSVAGSTTFAPGGGEALVVVASSAAALLGAAGIAIRRRRQRAGAMGAAAAERSPLATDEPGADSAAADGVEDSDVETAESAKLTGAV